jgi:integrase
MQLSPQKAPPGGAGTASNAPATGPKVRTLAELIDAYQAAYVGRDPSRPRMLAFWRGEFGPERPFHEITDEDVFAGLERLKSEPARRYAGRDADGKPVHRGLDCRKPATVNRYHAAAMALFTWAIKRRHAPRGWENPARRIERAPERNQVTRFLSPAERERLLAACRRSGWPRLYLLVLMALTTGARRGELLGLTWGDVDFERSIAYVRSSKNGEPRALPLLPAVLAELERFRLDRREACVFPGRGTKGLFVPAHFGSSWRSAVKAAELKDFRFHDLRHTTASYLAQNGASLLEIADVMGHRQLQMVKRYAHLTTDSKAKLVHRVLGAIK